MSINTLHYNGKIHADCEAKGNAQSVFTNEDQSSLPHFSNKPPYISNLKININGIFNLLSKIEPSKAAGPDEIPPRLLKETGKSYGSFHVHLTKANFPRTGNLQMSY